MMKNKTIVGLSTPLGNGAIHIIRVSGEGSFKNVSKICKNKIKKVGYTIERNKICDHNEIIDDVLLMKFVAPKSFTGEDMIEINCHGGQYIAKKIISLLLKNGCILAKKGEFSKKAFINGKISLIEANGINNIINATTDLGILHATSSFDKKTFSKINSLREKLFNLIGMVEINIDYPEYKDQPEISRKDFFNSVEEIKNELKRIYISSSKIMKIKDGIKIAIVGKPNVGKSSILNLLSRDDRAIVSNIPGTTRDSIESQVTIGKYKIIFVDTAGIRKSSNLIENIGISKTKKNIKQSDLILLIFDLSKKIDRYDNELLKLTKNKSRIIVLNKKDLNMLNDDNFHNAVKISAKKKQISELENAIKNWLDKNYETDMNNFLQTENELAIVKKTIKLFEKVVKNFKRGDSLDLLIEIIRECYENLGLIIGIGNDISFIDKMFEKFCLGK